jgi:hypothetical protein
MELEIYLCERYKFLSQSSTKKCIFFKNLSAPAISSLDFAVGFAKKRV